MFLLKLTKYAFFIFMLLATQLGYAADSTCHENTPGQMTDRFTDLGDGTALDTQTKLIWQRCNFGQVWHADSDSCQSFTTKQTWRDSLTAIKNYNDTAFAANLPDDWRMPNIKELSSIIDLSCAGLTLNTEIFLVDEKSVYWTSTPNAAGISFKLNSDSTGYIDENLIWTIDTEKGTEQVEALSSTRMTIMVRGPEEP